MDESWFDSTTGMLRFDEIVAKRPTFQMVLQDGIVTAAEFRAQSERVRGLMEQLETELPPEAKSIATETLAELAVLFALSAQLQARK